MTAGRNKVMEAIEAWRALPEERRAYFLDKAEDLYHKVGSTPVGCSVSETADVAVALLRAAAEPKAKCSCDREPGDSECARHPICVACGGTGSDCSRFPIEGCPSCGGPVVDGACPNTTPRGLGDE